MFRGANLCGGGEWNSTTTGPLPGRNYLFMSVAEIDRLIQAGTTGFRLLFCWEFMQTKPWQTPSGTYFETFKARVQHITSKGCVCVIDIHGGEDNTFGAYKGVPIGKTLPSGEAVTDLFENLYWNLGQLFRDNPLVQWGLTNEPINMTATVWFTAAQKAISALRRVGANQTVWAPGIGYSGAGTWVASGNAAAWNLVDPANNLGIQVHMYFDPNSGGGTEDIVRDSIGVERLTPAVEWCKSKGLKMLLGEVGLTATNPIAAATWAKTAAYIESNSSVIGGVLHWAAGPDAWWGAYKFSLCNSVRGNLNLALIKDSWQSVADLQRKLSDALAAVAVSVERNLQLQVLLSAATTERDMLRRIVSEVRTAVSAT